MPAEAAADDPFRQPPRRPRLKWLCIAATLVAMPFAAQALHREVALARALQAMDTGARFDLSPRAAVPPREALVIAALLMQQAGDRGEPIAARATARDRARALLVVADRAFPGSAAVQVQWTQLALLDAGRPTRRAIGHLAQSYAAAGFLRREGPWRIAFAVSYWPWLSDEARSAAVDEAVWLATLNTELRRAVDHIVAGSPASLPVQLRLFRRDVAQRDAPDRSE